MKIETPVVANKKYINMTNINVHSKMKIDASWQRKNMTNINVHEEKFLQTSSN